MDNWNFNSLNPTPNPIGSNMMNMGRQNPMYSNYMPAPHYDLIKVNGEAGARNFRMAPNSATLLLDENAPIVWLVQTDGSGLLTPTPFDISVHQPAPQVDLNNLVARVSALEELINAKSNTFANKQSKKQRQQSNADESASNTAD